MSIKLRRDGATFPTEVKDGSLIIHLGDYRISIDFKFLKEDFEYDNTEFPMCNVMCYLNNGNHIIIMRFDGTVTIYTQDYTVIGFTKFDKQLIYNNTTYLPVGTVLHLNKVGEVVGHTLSTIYSIKNIDDSKEQCLILECIGDPEPIVFYAKDNPKFCDEILHGTRHFPRLIKRSVNLYADDSNSYIVNGRAIKTTGLVSI